MQIKSISIFLEDSKAKNNKHYPFEKKIKIKGSQLFKTGNLLQAILKLYKIQADFIFTI